MNIVITKNVPSALELNLSESASLLQLTNQILKEVETSDILNPKVSISLDSCSIMHLKDLKNILSNLIDIQIDDKK
jgi:hypothetical protein